MKKSAKLTCLAAIGLMATACASAPLTLNDNIIVAGDRVGDVEIGMPLAQLVNLKGVPRKTIPIAGTAATTYFYDGLTVAADDHVYWIIAKDPRFRTQRGVAVGSEQIFARASFGQPDCVVTRQGSTVYDYGNLYFDVDNATGLVTELGIQDKTQNCRG